MANTIRMTGRQKMMLILLLGAQFMLSVDFSILNVALPEIGKGLHFNLANLQWIATSFSLVAAGFTLFFGRIADFFGRRRFFVASMILLAIGSLLGGLATNPQMMLAARVAQGFATAMVTPVAFALLTTSFKEGPLRDKALGLNGALLSAGFTVGSVLGGVLTSVLSWRWAFFINIPVALFIALLTPKYIQESRGQKATHIDAPGALSVTVALLALVYGVTSFGESSFTHPLTGVSLAVSLVSFIVFGIIEKRSRQPLLAIRILKRRAVKWGNVSLFTVFAMETAMVFLTTLYLQKVLGLSAAVTGLAFGLMGVAAFLTGIILPKYIEAFGSRRTAFIGLVGQGATTLLLVAVGMSASWLWFVLAVTFVNGFFHMAALVASMVTATAGSSNTDEGAITSLTSMTQLSSISLGIPLMSAVLTERTNAFVYLPEKLAVLHSYHDAILVDGLLTIGIALVVALRLRQPNTKTATQALALQQSAD
jgi:EmrB/QacA subfamily drug resistance transporter